MAARSSTDEPKVPAVPVDDERVARPRDLVPDPDHGDAQRGWAPNLPTKSPQPAMAVESVLLVGAGLCRILRRRLMAAMIVALAAPRDRGAR